MRPTSSVISALGAACLLSACATTNLPTTDFDPAQDFSTYKSFAWAAEDPVLTSGDRIISPMVKTEIKTAITDALSQKGYTFVESREDADFAVAASVGTRDGIDIRSYPDLVYVDPVWGQRYYVNEFRHDEYTEGSLAVDIFDLERKTPVWHSYGDKKLTRSELRGENASTTEAVQSLLSGFPPE